MLFYGALNDAFKGMASGVVVLWVKYPSANRCRLIGQLVKMIGGDDDFPDWLFGLFTNLVAALMQCCTDSSNICGDSQCFGRFGFFHW